jgi:hypothetical protein
MDATTKDDEEGTSKEDPESSIFYESVGAPVLLYRNRESYTPQDDDPRLWNALLRDRNGVAETAFQSYTQAAKWFCERQSDLYRTTARFYYPIDSHLLRLPKRLPQGLDRRRRAFSPKPMAHTSTTRHVTEENAKFNGDNRDEEEENTMEGCSEESASTDQDSSPATSKSAQHPSTKERNRAFKRMFRDDNYNRPQLFQLQRRVRGHMLLVEALEEDDVAHRIRHVRQKLQAYTQLDTNFVPAKESLRRDRSSKRTASHFRVFGLHGIVRQQTQLYDRERLHRSQPAFLAPFHLSSLRNVVAEDIASRGISYKKSASSVMKEIPAIPRDDPHSPTLFGNCLLVLPCRCDVCSKLTSTEQGFTSSPCLLHPVGPLQDRLRCSFIQLPHGIPVAGHFIPRLGVPEECKINHRIRQLELCGRDPYIVLIRTEVHCVVATLTFSLPRREEPPPPHQCWGTANWTLLHRIDYRTLWRSLPSLRPLDVTCHPKYGIGSMTPSKIAVVYESSHGGTKNTIYHMQITPQSVSVQKFNILNLQEIVEISFASHHPMVLWCIGRSYVRPALTSTYLHAKRPQLGHGLSLYCIDLRCSDPTATMAVFQWSPSAEEFAPEGIHSLSGLRVDWKNDHSLWVSSISAGKTYRLDSRTPCRVLFSYSLPYLCDEPSAFLPSTGLYGAGILFSQPVSMASSEGGDVSSESASDVDCMLSVAKTPCAHCLHVYQLPARCPLFQIPSVESITGPGVANMGNGTLSACSMIPLPDTSDQIFICGIASFQTPLHTLCSPPSSWSHMGLQACLIPGLVCILSLTNKGDVYTHVLLTSMAEQRYAKAFEGLPLGYSAISAPFQDAVQSTHPTTWNTLKLRLSNDFPVPGNTVRYRERKRMEPANLDLASFIEKEDRSILLQENILSDQHSNGANQGKKEDDPERRSFDNINSKFDAESTTEDFLETPALRVTVPSEDLPLRGMVVTHAGAEMPVSLFLPKRFILESDRGHSVEYFQRGDNVSVNRVSDKEKVGRSDLTPNILDDAWEDLTSCCSDDASMESI